MLFNFPPKQMELMIFNAVWKYVWHQRTQCSCLLLPGTFPPRTYTQDPPSQESIKKKPSRLLSNHLLLQVIWLICWFVSGRSDKVTGKDQAEERIQYYHKNRYSSVISCHISYLHAFLEADPMRYRFKSRRDRIFRDQTHSGFVL